MKLMYGIRCVFCMLFAVVCLSSCSIQIIKNSDVSTNEENDLSVASGEIMSKSPFELDPNKTNLPSYAVLSKIKEGMTKDEVIAIAGNPQRMELRQIPDSPTSSLASDLPCFVFDSSDGQSLCIALGLDGTNRTTEIVIYVSSINKK